jgi:tRNAThr (cytosine32-N3)-methyltransferase
LTNEDDVWTHNAWDHVPPPDDQEEKISASIARQKAAPVPDGEKQKYNEKPAKFWCVNTSILASTFETWASRDNFYKNNAANFFRDRKW